MSDRLTLADYEAIARNDPRLARMIARQALTSYAEFIRLLYEDIDYVIDVLEDNPELRASAKEDHVTIEIKNNLVMLGYDAEHDAKVGGHADLTVRDRRHNFQWLGEAKIFGGSYKYLYRGFLQLTTRYSTGTPKKDCGALLIYIREGNAQHICSTWKQKLQSRVTLNDLAISECPNRTGLAWFSTHQHVRSGRTYQVRHIGVVLGFAPEDSGGP